MTGMPAASASASASSSGSASASASMPPAPAPAKPPVPTPMPLPDQPRVLITGGAGGLGLALAAAYLDRGARVLVADLAPTRPDGVPGDAAYLTLDVRSDADWARARDWVDGEWGGLDLLVNNAGLASGGRIDHDNIDDWQRMFDVNLFGVARGCRTFAPVFKAQRSGHILNIASAAGLIHGPGMSSYNAAKAGVVALSETLGFELSPWGIGVAVACPSFFRTNLHAGFVGADTAMQAAAVALIDRSPLSAEEVASAIVAGLDAGEQVIVPDELARATVAMKNTDPQAYAARSHALGQRLAGRSTAEVSS